MLCKPSNETIESRSGRRMAGVGKWKAVKKNSKKLSFREKIIWFHSVHHCNKCSISTFYIKFSQPPLPVKLSICRFSTYFSTKLSKKKHFTFPIFNWFGSLPFILSVTSSNHQNYSVKTLLKYAAAKLKRGNTKQFSFKKPITFNWNWNKWINERNLNA